MEIRERLSRSEESYRLLMELASDGIVLAGGPDGHILEVNRRFCEMTGYARGELLLMKPEDLADPEDLARSPLRVQEMLEGQTLLIERPLVRRDGQRILTEISTKLLPDGRVQFLVRDVTERRRLESRLQQIEKMEAVARLASGMAHDFNNLLTVVQGWVEILAEQPGLDEEGRTAVEEIGRAAARAAGLTGQLLGFSRQRAVKAEPVDLCEVVREAEPILRSLLGEDVDLRLSLTRRSAWVRADRRLLQQALVNLAANARDAGPGRVVVRVRAAGDTVGVEFEDTGCGMAEETRRQAFEPFFTTKEDGGTGLGLTTVYGLVHRFGGEIELQSAPGEGTLVRLDFPRARGRRRRARRPAAGGETLLVVDDEAPIRLLLRRVLEADGYRVLEAGDGEEALRLARQHRLHLLVSDVRMPRMGGPALARRLKEERPELKVLFMSGYSDGYLDAAELQGWGAAFLAKPFEPRQVLRRVRSLLG